MITRQTKSETVNLNWWFQFRLVILSCTPEQTKIFISNENGPYQGGRMDLITVIEDLQALLVLVIFLMIIAVGFKIWAWNYSVPHK
jgi:hypothetical protein